MFTRAVLPQFVSAFVLSMSFLLIGCGRVPAPVDAPMRYSSIDALNERLKDIAKYGDGGSSLGGIPESIEELTKSNPELGARLLASFQRLNTTDSKEDRKKIALEMAEQLKK